MYSQDRADNKPVKSVDVNNSRGRNSFRKEGNKIPSGQQDVNRADTSNKVTPHTQSIQLESARPGIESDNTNIQKDTGVVKSKTPTTAENADKREEVKENQGVE